MINNEVLDSDNAFYAAHESGSKDPFNTIAENYINGIPQYHTPQIKAFLLKHPCALLECCLALYKRMPELESELPSYMNSDDTNEMDAAYRYTKFIMRTRWPELEPVIAKSAYSRQYAVGVLKISFALDSISPYSDEITHHYKSMMHPPAADKS